MSTNAFRNYARTYFDETIQIARSIDQEQIVRLHHLVKCRHVECAVPAPHGCYHNPQLLADAASLEGKPNETRLIFDARLPQPIPQRKRPLAPTFSGRS